MKKPCRKCAPKANSRHLFNFGKYPKTAVACKGFRYFEREFMKSFKKVNFIFLLNRMSSVCHSYVTRINSYVICMPLICTRMWSVCPSYVISMSLVCICIPLVCYSYVLVCHSYVTRLWSYHEPLVNKIIV